MIRLTRNQVRQVDRIAIERYRIPGIVLMENAARGATQVALAMLRKMNSQRAVILAGGGNNGGDGLAVARHLHNTGCEVRIVLCTDPAKYSGDALINWQIVEAMGLPVEAFGADALKIQAPALIVDAIFGTGLSQPPRPPFADIVAAVERYSQPVLAIDLPSGLDCDSGDPLGEACIRATRTVTFVAQKKGFSNPASGEYTGKVSVAGIGCPPEVIGEVLGT